MGRQLQHILILILLAVCGSVAHATETERFVTDEAGREGYSGTEKPENLVTWVYDGTSFTPVAKVTDGERYTIVHDYLGTPTQAYDSEGNLVWEMLLDVYGEVMECRGDRSLVPFRYQGQYEDTETGLYYNRFRYYSPEMGMYISSDPIGLAGNNPTLYGYVQDVNTWLDVFGLKCDVAKAKQLAQTAKGANELFECKTFASDLKSKLQKEGISGELLEVKTVSNKSMFGNIWSDKAGTNISTNGTHQAIKVGDTVFDNMNPSGIHYDDWKSDLLSPGGHTISSTTF